MGNILKAIYDDIDDYLYLCKKYGEEPEYSIGGPNPYGKHAKELKERAYGKPKPYVKPKPTIGQIEESTKRWKEGNRKCPKCESKTWAVRGGFAEYYEADCLECGHVESGFD